MGQKLIHFQSIWKLNGAITIIVSSFQPRIYKQHFKSNKNFYVSIKFLLYVFISLTKRNIKTVSGFLKTLGRTWNNTLSPTGSLAFLWDSKCHNTCKKTFGLYITLICNLHLILTNNHCIIVRIKNSLFEETQYNVQVALAGCHHQRCPASVVTDVDVCPSVHQPLNHLQMPSVDCKHQRCPASPVAGVDVSTLLM